MAYVPLFVSKATVADFHPLITAAMISDTMIRSADRRVKRDLARASKLCGVSLTPTILLATTESTEFAEYLEDAAMYACLAALNSIGYGNTTVGPITSVSGDGMAKTHGYMSGSTLKEALSSAEEMYQRIIQDIIQCYFAYGHGPVKKPIGRYNEIYQEEFWEEGYDERKSMGNDQQEDLI